MQKNNHFDNSAKIPKWLLTTDEYTPPKDKDKFWQKALFSITTKLIFLRHHNYPHKNSWLNPSEKIITHFSHHNFNKFCTKNIFSFNYLSF